MYIYICPHCQRAWGLHKHHCSPAHGRARTSHIGNFDKQRFANDMCK